MWRGPLSPGMCCDGCYSCGMGMKVFTDLWTPARVAEHHGVDRRTVYQWVRRGKLRPLTATELVGVWGAPAQYVQSWPSSRSLPERGHLYMQVMFDPAAAAAVVPRRPGRRPRSQDA